MMRAWLATGKLGGLIDVMRSQGKERPKHWHHGSA